MDQLDFDLDLDDPLGHHKREWDSTRQKREKALQALSHGLERGEVAIISKRRRYLKERHFVGFQTAFETLAQDDLGANDFRVLLHLLARLDWDNWVRLTQTDIGEDLGLKQPNVARSLKKLRERGYINARRLGRDNYYQLNPHFVWKGEAKARETAMQEAQGGKLLHLPLPGVPGIRPRALDEND